MSPPPTTAQQGHPYTLAGERVIALDSGENPRVGVIGDPWFSRVLRVAASELVPVGLRYLGGAHAV